jgi:5'-nucleotidase
MDEEFGVRILLTNDDGIYAPGLRALFPELQKLGEVIVVAPATEQSAVGHSVTLTTPLVVQEVVVSGLNAGSNAGINVLYSGTVAAAIEGSFFRCTSVACSLEYTKLRPLDFERGAELTRKVIEQILQHQPEPGSLFNINIPSPERDPIRGIRTVPQNVAPYTETFDRRTDPRGRVYFWNNPDFGCPDPHPDTDVSALAEGFITVTPLHFNLTHVDLLSDMSNWQWRSL